MYMRTKQHETPEFQVIRQNEANAKFFVASFSGEENPVDSTPAHVNSYTILNSNDLL